MSFNLERVIWGLEELSDKAEQERLWLGDGKSGQEVSSFHEAVCCTFDDTGLSILMEEGMESETISTAQFESIKQLLALCKSIPSHLSPRETIDRPDMVEVRKLAEKILATFRVR